ncbi:hypothetical protein ICS_00572 [Bacillus cereus BAG2O-3]|nr:hypothetical protein ICS_00572 [Bacillus cereus BAG2O-3]
MKQNQLLHNVSHETIDIPNYLSTIFDWFQTWASYENLTKINTEEKEPVFFHEVDMYMKKLVESAM